MAKPLPIRRRLPASPWTLPAWTEEHVRQLRKMGGVTYLATHIWARIVKWNIWGKGHWIEDDAYRAETL